MFGHVPDSADVRFLRARTEAELHHGIDHTLAWFFHEVLLQVQETFPPSKASPHGRFAQAIDQRERGGETPMPATASAAWFNDEIHRPA